MKAIRFFLFIFCFGQLAGQQIDSTQQIKLKIEALSEKGDILAINRLINSNSFLDPEYAFRVLNENLQRAQIKNQTKEYADSYISLGNFWYSKGNLAKAFESYLKAETISNTIDNKRMAGISIMNRSHITENNNEKIELLGQAISLLEQVKDTVNLAKAHLNLGNAYSSGISNASEANQIVTVSERQKALKQFAIAENLNRILKNPEIAASVFVHRAEWYKYDKQYELAKADFLNAEKSFVEAGRIKGKVYVLEQMAEMALEEQKGEDVLSLLQQAEEIAKTFEYRDDLSQINKLYFKYYKQQEAYGKAIDYLQKYHAIFNDLKDVNSRDKIHGINLEHRLEKQQRLLEESQKQKDLYRIIVLVALVFIGCIIGISYLIIQNKKRKIETIAQTKQMSDIKIKNQELQEALMKEKLKFNQEHLMSFANQVNQIDEFLDTLEGQVKHKGVTSKDEVNALKLSFSEILNDQNYIKQLQSLSKEVNQDFLMYVRKHYKKITKNDEQLLSYLILEMSSKEIAGILKISTESVHTKRYRLRKKLDLESEESFIDFYKRITNEL
ncbi:LuxR C-terminal-related transcriptional regulator [Formosa sp. S-31]|uniref:LuxR C-terminal-related transcriptional regulator n=1 Tax=Formosa sp. S-31 TaxID=2790949 RepID=UPI003EBE7149